MDILIIPYENDKAEDLCNVHNSAFKSYIEEFGILYGYEKLSPNDIHNWIKNQESKIWLAYADNEPVGYVHCSQRIEEMDNFDEIFKFKILLIIRNHFLITFF